MRINSRNIFLIDGAGAVITAIMHGIVLPVWSDVMGVPPEIFYKLGVLALIFSLYSFTCHFLAMNDKAKYLGIIASANIVFVILTVTIIIYFYSQITLLGIFYFLAEVIIVSVLVKKESEIINGIRVKERQIGKHNF